MNPLKVRAVGLCDRKFCAAMAKSESASARKSKEVKEKEIEGKGERASVEEGGSVGGR